VRVSRLLYVQIEGQETIWQCKLYKWQFSRIADLVKKLMYY